MTAETEVVAALEKALDAAAELNPGYSPFFIQSQVYRRLENVCNLIAIRTLLDAHASALRDAAKLRKALSGMCGVWKTVCDSKGWEPGHVSQYTQARSALDDNTKGAPQ